MTTFNLSVGEVLKGVDFSYSGDTDFGTGKTGWHRAVSEALSIADTSSSTNHTDLSVVETMAVHTLLNENTGGAWQFFKKEFLSASDTVSLASGQSTNALLSVADHVSARITTAGHAGIYNISVTETMTATDIDIDPETFNSLGINFWGYHWALDAGITHLSVYCAGLDLGDWPVLPQGQVFVPWLSDADQLFTPGFLINMSNALSGDVPDNYGATACNIDLHNNNGDIIRIIVDLAIGVPYKSRLQLVRPNGPDMTHSQSGPSLAETRRLHQIGLQLNKSQGLHVGTDPDHLRSVVFMNNRGDKYAVNRLFTGIYWSPVEADYNFDNMILVEVHRPWPATIAALIGFLKTFDRE